MKQCNLENCRGCAYEVKSSNFWEKVGWVFLILSVLYVVGHIALTRETEVQTPYVSYETYQNDIVSGEMEKGYLLNLK